MDLEKHHIPADRDRLPLSRIVAYGMGGIIPIALFNIAGQLMGLMGNISLGLSAFWLGVIMIIPRLWDAVSDPLMGHISDNIRTPWGRRRPFILIGAIAVAISFVVMWWIPDNELVHRWFPTQAAFDWFRLGYILFWLLIFFTACTVFEIPHGALGMEMSGDTHERTKLFSAKSFLGNLFAMGTPWLFFLANLEFFRGAGGNEADGMRWVSMLIAVVIIPMAFWWFFANKEPVAKNATEREKTSFWSNARVTFRNRAFLILVGIFFILGMGFNFVGLLNYYISIYYLYGGDKVAAGPLMGINGTIWAITGLLAVFPLNWLDRRCGKRNTLVVAILLMCGAQLSKIFCYNPEHPYLVIIPTIMLSAGMLMFFTLGPSMLGDICDEDELKTGRRADGSYYSIYWWFFKMGTAFASLVTGSLIVFSQFNETQSSRVDKITGSLVVAQTVQAEGQLDVCLKRTAEFRAELEKLEVTDHRQMLLAELAKVENGIQQIKSGSFDSEADRQLALQELGDSANILSRQSPKTLLRLRIIEISLPLVLSLFSLLLTFKYPLSEKRIYEIKAELERRRENDSYE
jgi:GPH family glycoside/pentoside/hexuronide:cation symporter